MIVHVILITVYPAKRAGNAFCRIHAYMEVLFMCLSKKVCSFVHNLLLFAGVIILFIAILCTQLITVMGLGAMGMALIALAYGFTALFWRCPDCKKRLPWKEGNRQVSSCPHCGRKLS
ncbi:MAG: hypothetical protein K2P02_06355 [Lachnospiraceae bacterium]|nr:hypothetical protein [Lachnospiraceae bacterium]